MRRQIHKRRDPGEPVDIVRTPNLSGKVYSKRDAQSLSLCCRPSPTPASQVGWIQESSLTTTSYLGGLLRTGTSPMRCEVLQRGGSSRVPTRLAEDEMGQPIMKCWLASGTRRGTGSRSWDSID
jgi:hypothetical protein